MFFSRDATKNIQESSKQIDKLTQQEQKNVNSIIQDYETKLREQKKRNDESINQLTNEV